jgi:hypothetical protein
MDTLYASIGIPAGSDTLGSGQIAKLPDIQTRTVIESMLKNFSSIFNEKTLGDELLAIHNAGRYTSGATVNADIAPVAITLMDQVARDTLRTSNDAIIDIINTRLRSGIASPLVIFDRKTILHPKKQVTTLNPDNTVTLSPLHNPYTEEIQNYYFGTPAKNIQNPSQCTIARGFSGETSVFGRSILTEANSAYDIKTLDGHIELLKNDTEELTKLHQSAAYSCFDSASSVAKTQSYW